MAASVPPELAASYGSNNWVIGPARTASGSPILANDPHRIHAVPSLRYVAHLVAPGLNVIGAGEPTLPGISIGHNERIAFGLTIFAIDQEDLYFYGPDEPVERVLESIAVRDGPPVEVTLEFTRHGPVVHRDAERLFALRTGWLEPGMAPYFGSIEYMRASNWREFRAALNRWGAPSENQVYADVDGNIGYKPAGLFPRRTNHDGLLPVPGDGRHEWQGFFDMDALPEEYNPPRGFIATANVLAAESAQAAFFSVWYHRHLVPALAGWVLGDQDAVSSIDSLVVPELLLRPEAGGLVAVTLDAAHAETTALLGAEPARWRWGDLHRTTLEHPLLHLAEGTLGDAMRMSAYGRGGSGQTVNNTGFDARDFAVRVGASWRMVVDTGDWDGARMTNAPGQSGDPESPFYDNLLETWAEDGSFPLLYSREAIEAHTETRIRLVPKGAEP